MGEAPRPHCCCASEDTPAPTAPLACPACGGAGRAVEAPTLRALLQAPWAADMGVGPWRFCDNPACDLVYFGAGGTYRRNQLRVRVGIKETEAPRPLCYCFGHSVESLRDQWQATGRLDALEDVRAAVKAGRCRCDLENPSGACCLGDLLKAAQVIQASGTPP